MASEWQQLQLGKVCRKIGSGATPRGGKDAYRGGKTALIRSQNIYNDRFAREGLVYIDDAQAHELRNVVVEENDVLLNITGDSVARCCQVDPDVLPARVNQHVAIIRTQPDVLDARFLRYVLVAPAMQAHLLALASAGATRNALTKSMIESLTIKAPPISEQRAIAHILGTLDDKIELNRKQNETLEAMARALFKAWFVDFEPVRAKMEGRWQRGLSLPGLPAHLYDLFPDRLIESELGEIPEGWKYAPLSEFIEILDSRRVPLSGKQRAERRGIYPYHGAAGVMDFVDDYLFDGIHVLIGEDGSVVKDDGRPYTQYVWGKFWVNNHAHVLRGRGITNETLLIFLDQCDIAPFVTGAVQPKLSQGNLKKIPFIDAGEWLLNGFGEVISPLFKKIRDATEELRALVQIRDTLLPKLISGELRVPDVDKFMEAMA
jgi:Restriction endonuclease S subunits